MKRAIVLACLSLALYPASALAGNGERYAPRPPLYLSPDLSEPWLMQLKPRYRDVVGAGTLVPLAPARTLAPPRALNPATDGSVERRVAVATPVLPKGPEPRFLPQDVAYTGAAEPGSIIVDTNARFLYLVGEGGKARRYGVGVGRPGFEWAGMHTVTRKAEWPDWRPPTAMRKRQPNLPEFMAGGPDNPLGARALYLGSTEYRIHGTSEPWTIGQAVSSGCIRMRNQDVEDLYERVKLGTRVQVI